jgi:acetyl-CoA carboxylase biotin carboxylase subunit
MIKKLLVANRGEIALRVMRACKELGIKTVAIYSDIDKWMPFAIYADESYNIGPAPSTESYLKAGEIIKVAKKAKAGAIHPGYGFLAEDPAFAKLCEKEKIIFVGPSSTALEKAGNKINSKEIARKAGIPVVPAYTKKIKNETDLLKGIKILGYPVITKAAGGGGGRGMRLIKSKQDLSRMYREARSEAQSSFSDPTIYLEKYIKQPRHIEIQILADKFGNIIHLGERECSIQRRHQKLIEETPSTAVDEKLRQKLGDAAKRIAQLSGYTNAGTVEFLVDKDKNFYFLEVNARLQVEHPVTEIATGVDIVKEQIKIANGEKLPIKQEDIKIRSSVIECRICAEDPFAGFIPSTGVISALRLPTGPSTRVDIGISEGTELTMYYDSLIAKLITWGAIRENAISSMLRALGEFKIVGVKTTIPLYTMLLQNEEFRRGAIDTTFLDSFKINESLQSANELTAVIAASILEYSKRTGIIDKVSVNTDISPWRKTFLENQRL